MKDKYQHRAHNKNLLMVHIILATKYRKKLLFDDFRIYIKQLLLEICVTHHWYVKHWKPTRIISIYCCNIIQQTR